MKNSQKGITPLIIALIVAVVIGGGYLIVSQQAKNSPKVENTTATKSDVTFSVSGNSISVLNKGKVTQTLALGQDGIDTLNFIKKTSTGGIPIPSAFVIDKDVNFDGYNDVGFLSGTGYAGVNYFYDFYIFNPTTQKLEKNSVLSGVGSLNIDPATKQVKSTYKSGPGYVSDTYQWNGSTFIKSGPVPVTTTTSDWKTYTNSRLGFSFQYPNDLSFQSIAIPIPTVTRSNIPLSDGVIAMLPSGYNLPNSLQDFQQIYAGITSASNGVQCMPETSATELHPIASSINVNGTVFKKYEMGDCSMDGCDIGNTYTTWKNNICYELAWSAHQGSPTKLYDGSTDPRAIAALKDAKATTQNITNLTEHILSTLKFISLVTATSNLKTYTNSQYGFEVKYPSDFVSIAGLITPAERSSTSSYMEACYRGNAGNEIGFCYIGGQKSDGFTIAGLVVIPSTSISQQNCSKIEVDQGDPHQTPQITTVINGVNFYENKFEDAAAGHYVSTDSYRTYKNGTCYTIDLNVESTTGTLEKGLSADFSAMMLAKLQSILSTFKFTTPSTTTSDWKTYTNSSEKYSIKYPSNLYLNSYSTQGIIFTNYDPSLAGTDGPLPVEDIQINISTYATASKNETTKSWADELNLAERKDVLVDGIQGIEGRVIYTGKEESGYYTKGQLSGEYILFLVNGKKYQITYNPFGSKFTSTFDQMLSTLKFTK